MSTQAAFWDKAAAKYAKSRIADPAAYEYTLGRTQIVAMDVSSSMLAIAREKTEKAGIENLIFEESADVPKHGQYNVVMGYSIFHLVPDMESRFAQINKLLPKGGYFISKTACLGQRGSGIGGALKSLMISIAIPVMQLIGKELFHRRAEDSSG